MNKLTLRNLIMSQNCNAYYFVIIIYVKEINLDNKSLLNENGEKEDTAFDEPAQ